MRVVSERLRPFGLAAVVLLLQPFATRGVLELQRFREPQQVACIGDVDAQRRIVYLHGRDTWGPSWGEIRNREALRLLAKGRNARVALPRAYGGWPQGSRDDAEASLELIRAGAGTCFTDPAFGIVGFSDGANLANELFLQCQGDAAWIISAGSDGFFPRGRTDPTAGCGPIVVIAGRHEPTYEFARVFARQLASRGADARFVEHQGAHELPFPALVQAVDLAEAR